MVLWGPAGWGATRMERKTSHVKLCQEIALLSVGTLKAPNALGISDKFLLGVLCRVSSIVPLAPPYQGPKI